MSRKDDLFDFMHSDEMGNAGDQIGHVLKGIGKLLFSDEDIVTGKRPETIDAVGTSVEAPPSSFAECIHGPSCAGYRGDARCNVYEAVSPLGGPETVREGSKKEARVPSAPSSDSPPVASSRFCEECGSSCRSAAKFCPKCGMKI